MSGVGKDEIVCFESENSPMGEMSIGRQFEIMVDMAWQVVGNVKLRSVWMAGLSKRVRPSADCFERLFFPWGKGDAHAAPIFFTKVTPSLCQNQRLCSQGYVAIQLKRDKIGKTHRVERASHELEPTLHHQVRL